MRWRECLPGAFCVVRLAESNQTTVIFSNGLDGTPVPQTSAPRTSRMGCETQFLSQSMYSRITGPEIHMYDDAYIRSSIRCAATRGLRSFSAGRISHLSN
jgi:hypothetical protein